MTTKIKPLSAYLAADYLEWLEVRATRMSPKGLDDSMSAIANGRHEVIDKSTHVAVEKMTEAQVRERFVEKYGDDYMEMYGTCEWCAWLSAHRSLGLIASEQEKKS